MTKQELRDAAERRAQEAEQQLADEKERAQGLRDEVSRLNERVRYWQSKAQERADALPKEDTDSLRAEIKRVNAENRRLSERLNEAIEYANGVS